MVMTCPVRSRLIRSSSAASVVLFPDPVGPLITTRPSRKSHSEYRLSGIPNSDSVRNRSSNRRSAIETAPWH